MGEKIIFSEILIEMMAAKSSDNCETWGGFKVIDFEYMSGDEKKYQEYVFDPNNRLVARCGGNIMEDDD